VPQERQGRSLVARGATALHVRPPSGGLFHAATAQIATFPAPLGHPCADCDFSRLLPGQTRRRLGHPPHRSRSEFRSFMQPREKSRFAHQDGNCGKSGDSGGSPRWPAAPCRSAPALASSVNCSCRPAPACTKRHWA
jgi:hypothetical protein